MRGTKRWGLTGALALVAAIAVAVVGVTTASGAKSAGTITLAYVADLSGQMAPFDNPALTEAKLDAILGGRGDELRFEKRFVHKDGTPH